MNLVHNDAQAIDDCWNRIGIRGDKSCPLLVEHVHCRNCSVYSAAATRLLDRYALQREERVYAPAPVAVATRSLLIFRLGQEWLGLATRSLVEIAPLQSVHSLPHQRSAAVVGVVNVRGALVACLSLAELLGIPGQAATANGLRVIPRLLILAAEGGPVVAAVDEIDGIHAIEEQQLASASAPAAQPGQAGAAARLTRGVLQWRERSVRLLDEAQLLLAVNRSLS